MGEGYPPLSVRQYAFEGETWHHKPGTEVFLRTPILIYDQAID